MVKKDDEKDRQGITRRGFLQIMGAGAVVSGTPGAFSAEPAAETAVKNAEPLDHNGYMIPLFRGILEEEMAAIAGIY